MHVVAALQRLGELGFDSALLAGTQYGERVVSEIGCEAILYVLEALSKRDAGARRRLASLRNVAPKHEEFMAKAAELDGLFLSAVGLCGFGLHSFLRE